MIPAWLPSVRTERSRRVVSDADADLIASRTESIPHRPIEPLPASSPPSTRRSTSRFRIRRRGSRRRTLSFAVVEVVSVSASLARDAVVYSRARGRVDDVVRLAELGRSSRVPHARAAPRHPRDQSPLGFAFLVFLVVSRTGDFGGGDVGSNPRLFRLARVRYVRRGDVPVPRRTFVVVVVRGIRANERGSSSGTAASGVEVSVRLRGGGVVVGGASSIVLLASARRLSIRRRDSRRARLRRLTASVRPLKRRAFFPPTLVAIVPVLFPAPDVVLAAASPICAGLPSSVVSIRAPTNVSQRTDVSRRVSLRVSVPFAARLPRAREDPGLVLGPDGFLSSRAGGRVAGSGRGVRPRRAALPQTFVPTSLFPSGLVDAA